MADHVFVALLGEGVDVWRRVPATKLTESEYVLLQPDDYDAADETWQFLPGSIVICEPRDTADGVILAAVRLRDSSRKTA